LVGVGVGVDLDEYRQVQPKEGRLLASKFACGYAEVGKNLNLNQIHKGLHDMVADIKASQNAPILAGSYHHHHHHQQSTTT
jgi:hypothetical protein